MSSSLPRVLGVVALLQAAALAWLTLSTSVSLRPLSEQGGGMVLSSLLLLTIGGVSAGLATAAWTLLRGDGRTSTRQVFGVAASSVLLLAATLSGVLDWMLYGSEILVGVSASVFVATLVTAFILQWEHANQEVPQR